MDKQIPAEQKEKIVRALKERGADRPCPRCGNPDWALLDGYHMVSVQPQFQTTVLGGPAVPCIATVCTRCGFLSQHALGALGLLQAEEKKNG